MLVSFIIPLFGQWKLTHQCLLSLKAHASECEIILIDNGAHVLDIRKDPNEIKAKAESLALGEEFENFVYLPQKKNLNFAGASNLGAKIAKAPFLFFLNNDTEVQAEFLAPLLEEIQKDSSLKIVAPLLLYPKDPKDPALAFRIQHLGITFTPTANPIHLYEYFPINHPLVKRERNLQAFTADAFLIRKNHFENFYFDEDFINGFEDVELCARFREKKGIFKLIHNSHIIHHTSQSIGRTSKEDYNGKLLYQKTRTREFYPDYHTLLEEDGFELHFNEFLQLVPSLNKEATRALQPLIDLKDIEKIQEKYLEEPFWQEGLKAIIADPRLSFEKKNDFVYLALGINNQLSLYYDFSYAWICNKLLELQPNKGLYTRLKQGFFHPEHSILLKEVQDAKEEKIPAHFANAFKDLYSSLVEKSSQAFAFENLDKTVLKLTKSQVLAEECRIYINNYSNLQKRIQRIGEYLRCEFA